MMPDPQNLQPRPGFVWVKSGYSEAFALSKVRLTKPSEMWASQLAACGPCL